MDYKEALEKIETAAQVVKNKTSLEYGTAQLLLDMAKKNRQHAEIIAEDLPTIGVEKAAKRLKEYARTNRVDYMDDTTARKLLSELYQLPDDAAESAADSGETLPKSSAPVDLLDLL